jgi:DNA-binding NarL/FixJ family response regulator
MTAPTTPAATPQGKGAPPLRILILDDHRTFAEALATRLAAEPGFQATAVTRIDDARTVLARPAGTGMPDVMLLDVHLGTGDGIRFARETRIEHPAIKILMVSAGEGDARVAEAVRCGVSGWIPKDGSTDQLIAAIRGSLSGETWIPPRLLTGVLRDLIGGERDRAIQSTALGTLTPRETEVLRCMVAGLSRATIADRLYVSPNTVRTHMQNVLSKLAVHSTLAAVALARRAGVLAIDE